MAMLPPPLIPDANQWIAARQAGYEQGEALRRRNLLLEAGQLAAAPSVAAPAVSPVQVGGGSGMDAYSNALSSIESGGRYDAIGPATRTGDRAYGKYQVMGANIPDWTTRHIGRRMTPQEFLADKDAQEKVFRGEFGGYVAKYGNPQDAASMWFSGRPAAQGAGRNDGYTSQPEYLRRFNAALGGNRAAQPAAQPVSDPNAGLRNASNALLRGGELQAGLGIQNTLFERSEKARAQAEARHKEGQAIVGEMALKADTPEKWARLVETARRGGLDVTGLEDFSMRDMVIARAGKSMDYMSAGKNGVFNKTLGRYEPRDPNSPTDAESLSKNATWVQDAEGNYQIAQLNESGDPRIAKFPEGIKVLPPSFTVDSGLAHEVRARPGGQALGSVPKNVAGEASEKKTGEGMAERQLNQPSAEAAVKSSVSGLKSLFDKAAELKSAPGLARATGVVQGGGWVPTVRQSTADAEAKLDTLKSKIAFGVLQAMRDASKTGGALGSIAVEELKMLQNNIASLDLRQGDEEFKKSLDTIMQYAQDAEERLLQGYEETYGRGGSPAAVPPPADTGGFKVLRVR